MAEVRPGSSSSSSIPATDPGWISESGRRRAVQLDPIVEAGTMDAVFTVHPDGWRQSQDEFKFTAILTKLPDSDVKQKKSKKPRMVERQSTAVAKCLEANRIDATNIFIYYRFRVDAGLWKLRIPNTDITATIKVVPTGHNIPISSSGSRALYNKVLTSPIFNEDRERKDTPAARTKLDGIKEEDVED
ncbi:uncharacterized protein B0I36DRAFT_368175 [Microdochium trichocladiopsis]|uniref:Uncharacterized protein n=1 Tax=Microdochium trichocladiopsis TaxID=1682393 RepID=A0A9P8XX65_9PEZI|nr:uncharacterized protein B0I36DRAFT_368175 [Microdochium trichocladiopsis]KAH7018132.1 hypothetical protein B0I36DRAFT_368175 [Microdochium trichocladiopsis]